MGINRNKITDYLLKLKALFHDPIHKIWVFSNKDKIQFKHNQDIDTKYKLHERVAEDLFRFLIFDSIKDDKINIADQIASALSRIVVAPNVEGENRKKFDEESSVFLQDALYICPFSGEKKEVDFPRDHREIEEVFETLGDKIFRNISSSSQMELAKRYFLFLWRFLPDLFPWIDKHPADSRAPNHSIYDHIVQTSAVVTCLDIDKPSFLLFTITPVQAFIASARKTSDLWAGSYLLSYLIYKAIEVIMEELGPDHIIFPNLRGQPLVDLWLYKGYFKNLNTELPSSFEPFIKWKERFDKGDEELIDKLVIANFPNRFLAIVPYRMARELGQKCKESIKGALLELVDERSELKESKDKVLEHLLSYLKPYWVALPFYVRDHSRDVDVILKEYESLVGRSELYETVETIKKLNAYTPNVGNAYSILIELAERFLASRKILRDFVEISPQRGEKCHLCGEYDILDLDWKKLAEDHFVKESENLCGVCLFKRLLPHSFQKKVCKELLKKDKEDSIEGIKYPSTSEMATVKYKVYLENYKSKFLEEFIEVWKKFNSKGSIPKTKSVPKLKGRKIEEIDGQWLMESSYREDYLKKEYGIEKHKEELKQMRELIKKLKEKHRIKVDPPTYYAILAMDGDNMGKWLKGELMPSIEELIHPRMVEVLTKYAESDVAFKNYLTKLLKARHPMSPSFHSYFSRKLSEFALSKVKEIVEEKFYGKLIYAGGDDVLAFLPVDEALDCAIKLNEAFRRILGERASTSCGIVFVHHKYPLSLALNEVREAEKMAKNRYGRSAVCIKYIAGSGQSRKTGMKWDETGFFATLIDKYTAGELSSKFAYDFVEIIKELIDINGESASNQGRGSAGASLSDEVLEIAKIVLKKLYRHKLGKERYDRDFEEKLLEQLEKYGDKVEDFSDMLVIGRFIASIREKFEKN